MAVRPRVWCSRMRARVTARVTARGVLPSFSESERVRHTECAYWFNCSTVEHLSSAAMLPICEQRADCRLRIHPCQAPIEIAPSRPSLVRTTRRSSHRASVSGLRSLYRSKRWGWRQTLAWWRQPQETWCKRTTPPSIARGGSTSYLRTECQS